MSDNTKAWIWLAEVMSTLTIIVSAAVMVVPKFADLKRRDTAARVLADVDVLRTAVYAFYSDSAYFPLETAGESIPEGLEAYLPRSFSFARSYGTIVYKNWPVSAMQQDTSAAGNATATNATATNAAVTPVTTRNVIGAIVTTRDPRIAATAAAQLLRTAQFTVGNKHTFVFFGT